MKPALVLAPSDLATGRRRTPRARRVRVGGRVAAVGTGSITLADALAALAVQGEALACEPGDLVVVEGEPTRHGLRRARLVERVPHPPPRGDGEVARFSLGRHGRTARCPSARSRRDPKGFRRAGFSRSTNALSRSRAGRRRKRRCPPRRRRLSHHVARASPEAAARRRSAARLRARARFTSGRTRSTPRTRIHAARVVPRVRRARRDPGRHRTGGRARRAGSPRPSGARHAGRPRRGRDAAVPPHHGARRVSALGGRSRRFEPRSQAIPIGTSSFSSGASSPRSRA